MRNRELGGGRLSKRKTTKWNEMTKYVHDKQWKIHNEFEKDKCKWSEVDLFLPRIFAFVCTNVLAVSHYTYPHTLLSMKQHQNSQFQDTDEEKKTNRKEKNNKNQDDDDEESWEKFICMNVRMYKNNLNEIIPNKARNAPYCLGFEFSTNERWIFVNIAPWYCCCFRIYTVHTNECVCVFFFTSHALVHAIVLMCFAKNQNNNQRKTECQHNERISMG